MAKYRSKKSNLIRWIVTIGIVVAVVIGFSAAMANINRNVTTDRLSSYDYKIAALDSDGKIDQADDSLVTKDFITVDGLSVNIKEKADIAYSLYFYDEDENFISSEVDLSEDYAGTVPETAKYVKIVITPTDDDSISIFEKSDYVEQLTVTVNK